MHTSWNLFSHRFAMKIRRAVFVRRQRWTKLRLPTAHEQMRIQPKRRTLQSKYPVSPRVPYHEHDGRLTSLVKTGVSRSCQIQELYTFTTWNSWNFQCYPSLNFSCSVRFISYKYECVYLEAPYLKIWPRGTRNNGNRDAEFRTFRIVKKTWRSLGGGCVKWPQYSIPTVHGISVVIVFCVGL